MLFDLAEYKNIGVIGTMSATMSLNNLTFNQADNCYTQMRDTRNSYFKALDEYYVERLSNAPLRRREAIHNAYVEIENIKVDFSTKTSLFWDSLRSLQLNSQEEFDNEVGEYGYSGTYTPFTNKIFEEYIQSTESIMAAVKNLFIVADGDTFEEYVPGQ